MADRNSTQSFSLFPQLPKEIRLMIWEMASANPRIVSVEMRPLKKRHLEMGREKYSRNKSADNSRDNENSLEASRPTSHDYERPTMESLFLNACCPGIKSNTSSPQILLACRESFAAAAKFYERVFSIDPSSPETYFNFYHDTLCIRYDTFGWYSQGAASVLDDLVSFSEHNSNESNRIKRLAILLDPYFMESIEGWLAEILCFFRGLERLALIVEHHPQGDTASPLCLIEPIDVNQLWLDLQIYLLDQYNQVEIPEKRMSGNVVVADVDLEVLRAVMEAELGQGYILPEINPGVIITRDYKEELEDLIDRASSDPDREFSWV